ncbi:Guanylate cyclase [Aphelenchoides besseyi]|nr:Guanylate cyclase [Aphelenchoides besseyi]
MTGMIKDIAEGLFFVHNSRLQQHGNLSAFTCVVGDRFEIKIQFYGMKKLKQNMERTLNHSASLYVAPEHIHQNAVGSQAGDVYSFAILCSTILSLEAPFDGIQTAELFKKIADGDRPQLETENQDPELIKLIRRCWCQIPSDRPKISEIRSVLILQQRSSNVMDHMFSLMENNAAELEQDVQMRRLELLEEKKKADILLNRMMPKEAAEKLKLGQSVEPQVYTEATVFFSDIVGFTVLASKSSPLQIINFLNNVYTLADEVIGQFDAYKVETIGDGMHVVSSIPKRNGHQHGQQIGLMAMEFQRAVKTLRMAHLPNHQIQMRVGVHTGSCVAGIVGMTAPRFCVFGDTVNIAAKMEASGRAGRIHITDQTNSFLQTHFPGQFTTMERGESLIKGIGTLNTHWLVPPEELNAFEP